MHLKHTTSISSMTAHCCFHPAALLRLRGHAARVSSELEEMKEEAAHTPTRVTVRDFLQKRSYREPILIVLLVNLGSQLSGFNAVGKKKKKPPQNLKTLLLPDFK